jgi:hypothetical protein
MIVYDKIVDFFAERIYDACKGFGTDEECIARILGSLDNGEVNKLRFLYDNKYSNEKNPFNNFRELMVKELGGDFQEAILYCLDNPSPKGKNHGSIVYQYQQ